MKATRLARSHTHLKASQVIVRGVDAPNCTIRFKTWGDGKVIDIDLDDQGIREIAKAMHEHLNYRQRLLTNTRSALIVPPPQ